MMVIALVSAALLLALMIVTVHRALRYVERHPELLTQTGPRTYQLCQDTFRDIAARYHDLKNDALDRVILAWHSPNGLYYLLTDEGVEERRGADDYRGAYRLRWDQIGGIGLRMQPGFRLADLSRDRMADGALTSGYGFRLLVVPMSGRTMEIVVATTARAEASRAEAVEFAAHLVAVAEQKGKRVNAVGFDRPPAGRRL